MGEKWNTSESKLGSNLTVGIFYPGKLFFQVDRDIIIMFHGLVIIIPVHSSGAVVSEYCTPQSSQVDHFARFVLLLDKFRKRMNVSLPVCLAVSLVLWVHQENVTFMVKMVVATLIEFKMGKSINLLTSGKHHAAHTHSLLHWCIRLRDQCIYVSIFQVTE